jgi:nucleoside-diphosphate-sugar epimerase
MRNIVTRRAGVIGSHIAGRLAEKHELVGLDNLFSGSLNTSPTSRIASPLFRAVLLTSRSSGKYSPKADGVFHDAAITNEPAQCVTCSPRNAKEFHSNIDAISKKIMIFQILTT